MVAVVRIERSDRVGRQLAVDCNKTPQLIRYEGNSKKGLRIRLKLMSRTHRRMTLHSQR